MTPVAALPLLHARQQALDREECGGEVAVDRGAPALLADLLERARRHRIAAGVGDEDVDGAELFLDAPPHCLDLSGPGDVGGDLNCLASRAPDLVLHRGERRGIPPVDRDPRAGGGETLRDRPADPARAAGY